MKIGVFDSGVGGITVLSELRRRFPGLEYVYLGDTAHVPYGPKSPAQIERLSRDCARVLRGKGVEALVVACNTASSLALPAIREEMGAVPVFGVVQPGAQAALDAWSDGSPVLVLATRATVNSQAYGQSIRGGNASVTVIEQACPLLVPMIEEGWIDHPILHQTIREYVESHARAHSAGVALLGCTHYPWIQDAIQKALPGWKVINSAQAIAELLGKQGVVDRADRGRGKVEWIFTDPAAVPAFAKKWVQE
jgi:glutamate racemase